MSVHIYFSNNSIRDTTLSCDSMGIHYTVSRNNGIITVTRWDSKTDSNVLVGEFKLPFFKPDEIRVGEQGEWQPLASYLHKTDSNVFIHDRYFEGNDGATYTWKTRWDKWGQLILTRGSDRDNKEPVIAYHRNQISKEQAYLEISDTTIMGAMDNIILAFLIMEKKRRDRQKYRQRGISGGR